MKINKVNRLQVERGMTQKELAQRLDVSKGLLCSVINGKIESNRVRYKLSRYLQIPGKDLFQDV